VFLGYLPCVVIVSLNVMANGTLPAIEEIFVTDNGNQDLADTATTRAKVSVFCICVSLSVCLSMALQTLWTLAAFQFLNL
jgi:hypothetical protein